MYASPSPISRVDQDSLLTIFELITSQMPDITPGPRPHRPLVVIRAASQVCRRWRQLLIHSPRIWGRLVDLGVAMHGPQRMEWMDEVLRRAGSQVPLWVTGKVVATSRTVPALPRFDSQAFFLRLFESSFERMERISLIIDISAEWTATRRTVASRFCATRAPILKMFHITFSSHCDILKLNTFQPQPESSASLALAARLFSDYAPSLEDVKLENVAIRMDAPWLSGIRKISLCTTTLTTTIDEYSLEEVLVLLQRTSASLESLTLSGAFLQNVRPILYSDNLNADPGPPTLSHIQIHTSPIPASKLLGHIKPRTELSCFRLAVHDNRMGNLVRDPEVLPSFVKYLPAFISSYFASNVSTRLLFRLGRHKFNFTDLTIPPGSGSGSASLASDGPTFSISFAHDLQQHVDQDAVMACLLSAFVDASTLSPNGVCGYQSVTELAISLGQIRRNMFSTLSSMLVLFENVQLMTTDDQSCQILLDLASGPDGNVLFPNLEIICLTNWPKYERNTCISGFISFLTHRHKVGFPIVKLDLTRFPNRSELEIRVNDLTSLELNAVGLEVVWRKAPGAGAGASSSVEVEVGDEKEEEKVCSYVCGSGDAEQLKILF